MQLLIVRRGSHVGLPVIPAVVEYVLRWLRRCDQISDRFSLTSDCIRIISTFDSSDGFFQMFRAIRRVWELVRCEGFLKAGHVLSQICCVYIIGVLLGRLSLLRALCAPILF